MLLYHIPDCGPCVLAMTIAYAVATHAGESCYYDILTNNDSLKEEIIMVFIKCPSPHEITVYCTQENICCTHGYE